MSVILISLLSDTFWYFIERNCINIVFGILISFSEKQQLQSITWWHRCVVCRTRFVGIGGKKNGVETQLIVALVLVAIMGSCVGAFLAHIHVGSNQYHFCRGNLLWSGQLCHDCWMVCPVVTQATCLAKESSQHRRQILYWSVSALLIQHVLFVTIVILYVFCSSFSYFCCCCCQLLLLVVAAIVSPHYYVHAYWYPSDQLNHLTK